MIRRTLVAVVTGTVLLGFLAGCTNGPTAPATPGPTTSPSASASPTPPPVASSLVVGLDGITLTDDAGVSSADFSDGSAVLALLEKVTGSLPEGETLELPYGGESTLVRYTWDGIRVIVDSAGEVSTSVAVLAPEVDGVPIVTASNLAVGVTRDELLSAGGRALVDTDDPTTAEYLGLGGREVPGTQSLSHPGSVGSEYILFTVEGDVVTQIDLPANDFSDI